MGLRSNMLLLTGLLVCGMLGGCNSVKSWAEDWKMPFVTPKGKELKEGEAKGGGLPDIGLAGLLGTPDPGDQEPRYYPFEAEVGESLDIEVERKGNAIQLVNRTVHSYKNGQIWLNQQYGADLAEVPIGAGPLLDMESFINEHGERYPVGRFLQPDRDKPLVLADLYIDGKLHKLVVRLVDWQHP